MDFSCYVENLTIAKFFKEKILDDDFIKRNPAYYQNYPSLFAKSFLVENDVIELLDIAGFLYYKSTLFTDSLIDQQDFSSPAIIIIQEDST